MVAGSDAVPGDWQRPTTGWIAGEFISDPYTVKLPPDLPPGKYRLEVGLYDTALRRMTTEEGINAAILSQTIDISP
jgi:hypothetical protein